MQYYKIMHPMAAINEGTNFDVVLTADTVVEFVRSDAVYTYLRHLGFTLRVVHEVFSACTKIHSVESEGQMPDVKPAVLLPALGHMNIAFHDVLDEEPIVTEEEITMLLSGELPEIDTSWVQEIGNGSQYKPSVADAIMRLDEIGRANGEDYKLCLFGDGSCCIAEPDGPTILSLGGNVGLFVDKDTEASIQRVVDFICHPKFVQLFNKIKDSPDLQFELGFE